MLDKDNRNSLRQSIIEKEMTNIKVSLKCLGKEAPPPPGYTVLNVLKSLRWIQPEKVDLLLEVI